MNHLKFCGCRSCREGMHRGKGRDATVKRVARRVRHLTKLALKNGTEPPAVLSVPFTD
jgi:hypothetical protein